MTSLLIILALNALPLQAQADADYTTCYWRGGKKADAGILPCRIDRYSMCYDRRYDENDVCQSNGLVWNPYSTNGAEYGSFWRTSCTDPSWESEFCINQMCPTTTESSATVTPCNNDTTPEQYIELARQGKAADASTKWCCWNAGCDCAKGAGIFLKDLEQSGSTSSAPSSTAQSTEVSSATGISSTIPSSDPLAPGDNSPSLGVPLGVGLGVGLAALGAILGGMWWFLKRKKRNSSGDAEPGGKSELHGESYKGAQLDGSNSRYADSYAHKTYATHEIDGREVPAEAMDPRIHS